MLKPWSWLKLHGLAPLAATRGCDVLLTDRQGYVFLLDVRAGTLELLAVDHGELAHKLATDDAMRERLVRSEDGAAQENLPAATCWFVDSPAELDETLATLGKQASMATVQ